MHTYAAPAEIAPERLRKGLLGALRYGKPFVLNLMSMQIDRDVIEPIFDEVRG